MHTQVIQEECKVATTEFISDLIDECNEDLCVDRFWMNNVIDEAMLFTDRGNHS